MNAMYAMDEMMTSNEINMNLAAVTPVVLIMYGMRSMFRFMFYVLLKLGKSKEECYASFRHVILDIERLLVMRDNPPSPPAHRQSMHHHHHHATATPHYAHQSVLGADDLGMLMLHIYECRVILWEDSRRFSPQALRDVAEDLAEVSGERGKSRVSVSFGSPPAQPSPLFAAGPVSVQQQLKIIARMCRTYPFLKVVSTGVPFDFSRLSHSNNT